MRTCLFIVVSLFAPQLTFGQKLVRNETDKYLKTNVKETSWEPLSMRMGTALRARCRTADDRLYIGLRVTMGDVFHINEGDRVFLLLDNNESLPISCVRGGVASYDYAPSSTYWYGETSRIR